MVNVNGTGEETELQMEKDPRWRALTLGMLSGEEEATLQRESPELYRRCRPLGPDDEARILERVEASLARREDAEHAAAREQSAVAAAPRARPVWRSPGARIGAAIAVAAMAMAPLLSSLHGGALGYAVSLPRGGGPVVRQLSTPGDRLEVALSPVGSFEGPVAFRGALLMHPESGRVRPWSVDLEPTPGKVFFLSGTRGDLFPGVPSGDWDMLIAVGRPGPRLSEGEMRSLAGQASNGERQVFKLRVVLRGACVGTVEQPCLESTP